MLLLSWAIPISIFADMEFLAAEYLECYCSHGPSPFPSFAAASCCLGVLSCLLLLHLSCFFLLSWFLHVVASPVVTSFVLSCLFSSMLLSSILLTQSCVGSCFCMHGMMFGFKVDAGGLGSGCCCCCCQESRAFGGQVLDMEFGCFYGMRIFAEECVCRCYGNW
ncbi:hypothetical protein U1Q18_030773 [Sarracenia purpurea var. burkii]